MSPRRHRLLVPALMLLAGSALVGTTTAPSAGAASASDRGSSTRGDTAARASGAITTSGSQVLRGGQPFVARGPVFEGFQYPTEAMDHCFRDPAHFTHPGGKFTRAVTVKFCKRHQLALDYFYGRRWTDSRPRPAASQDPAVDYTHHDALTNAQTRWHANTIRLNVNEALLDPSSTMAKIRDAASTATCRGRFTSGTWGCEYVEELRSAVAAATAPGRDLVVVISPFAGRLDQAEHVLVNRDGKQTLNDLDQDFGINTVRTARSMTSLAEAFGANPDVVLETLNEPYRPGGRSAGFDVQKCYVVGCTDNGVRFAGITQMFQAARKGGYTGPLVVQGVGGDLSTYALGRMRAKDRADVIFSSHPFLGAGFEHDANGDAARAGWRHRFGDMVTKHHEPVMITAWQALTRKVVKGDRVGNSWCTSDAQGVELPRTFLAYVEAAHIGVLGFAFDVPFSITRDFTAAARADEPTSMPTQNASSASAQATLCGKRAYGIGADLRALWARQAG